MTEVKFLGHVVSLEGISLDPAKLMPFFNGRAKNVSEICSFLGLAGYYIHFFKNFSEIVAPSMRLTKNDVRFDWGDICESNFVELK